MDKEKMRQTVREMFLAEQELFFQYARMEEDDLSQKLFAMRQRVQAITELAVKLDLFTSEEECRAYCSYNSPVVEKYLGYRETTN